MTEPLLLVGTGALATLFAARLSAAGIDVTLLGSWPEGLQALERDGAQLDDFASQPVLVARDSAQCHGIRYALVLVKGWQTERVARQLAECLPEDGLAISLQNGLGNDEVLGRILGRERVCRGITTIGATLLGPGRVHLGGEGNIFLEDHPKMEGLVECLHQASFNLRVVEDIQPLIWGKLVINSAINPLTALLRVKNGALVENGSAHALLLELAQESSAVAAACSIQLPYADARAAVEQTARTSADNLSSMLQDVLRGSDTEIEQINGQIVRLGDQKGVPVPYNRAILLLVKALALHGNI